MKNQIMIKSLVFAVILLFIGSFFHLCFRNSYKKLFQYSLAKTTKNRLKELTLIKKKGMKL
jgi:uncharacterized membrane protein YvbJ